MVNTGRKLLKILFFIFTVSLGVDGRYDALLNQNCRSRTRFQGHVLFNISIDINIGYFIEDPLWTSLNVPKVVSAALCFLVVRSVVVVLFEDFS